MHNIWRKRPSLYVSHWKWTSDFNFSTFKTVSPITSTEFPSLLARSNSITGSIYTCRFCWVYFVGLSECIPYSLAKISIQHLDIYLCCISVSVTDLCSQGPAYNATMIGFPSDALSTGTGWQYDTSLYYRHTPVFSDTSFTRVMFANE